MVPESNFEFSSSKADIQEISKAVNITNGRGTDFALVRKEIQKNVVGRTCTQLIGQIIGLISSNW